MGSNAIALGVNPPAPPQGPLQQAQGALSVQDLINQGQLQKQAMVSNQVAQQSNQIKLQQEQQAQKDTEGFNQAFKDAGGDWNQTIQNATKNGVSGNYITQRQIARADQVTKLATADKDMLANEATKSDTLAKDAVALKGITDPQERATTQQQMVNKHLLSGAGYKASDFPGHTMTDDELNETIAHNSAAQALIKEAQDNAAKAAAMPGAKAEATAKELSTVAQMFNGTPPNQLAWTSRRAAASKTVSPDTMALIPEQYSPENAESVRQLGIAPKDLANQSPDKQELQSFLKNPPPGYKATPIDFMRYQKSLTPAIQNFYAQGGGMGVPGTPGGPAGATPSQAGPTPPGGLPGAPGGSSSANPGQGAGFTIANVPPQIRSQVQEVLDYRGKMPPANSRNAQSNAIRQWVTTLKPDYDETTFPERSKVVNDYVKDASTGQLGSIVTALGHLGELNSAADLMTHENLPLLHSLQARFNIAKGDDAATTYKLIQGKVAPELASAYVKGGGSAGERGADAEDFDISKGYKQLKSNFAEAANLLNSKLASKRQDWNQTFKPTNDSDNFDNRFLTPDARNTLNALSSQAPTNRGKGPAQGFTRITASDGSLHDIPSEKIELAKKRDPGLKVQ